MGQFSQVRINCRSFWTALSLCGTFEKSARKKSRGNVFIKYGGETHRSWLKITYSFRARKPGMNSAFTELVKDYHAFVCAIVGGVLDNLDDVRGGSTRHFRQRSTVVCLN